MAHALPDHLVRPRQHVGRNGDSDLLRSFQIYNELKLHGLLHGKVRWLGTFKNSVHVVSSATVQSGETGAIGHKAADSDICAYAIHRG